MQLDIDIAALEELLDKEANNYHNTPSLLGKKWYGIGLEDNEANDQKDEANKKGIIRKMIDAIKAFIARVVAKIKSFFKSKSKSDVQAEADFVKNYKEPSAEAKAKAFEEYVRAERARSEKFTKETSEQSNKNAKDLDKKIDEREKDNKERAEKLAKIKAESDARAAVSKKKFDDLAAKIAKDKEVQEKLARAMETLFGQTGEMPTVEIVREKSEEVIVKKIKAKLTNHRQSMLIAMLGSTFHTVFAELLHLGDELTHTAGSKVTVEMIISDREKTNDLKDHLQACYASTNDAANMDENDQDGLLHALVGGDSEIAGRTNLYFQQTYNSVMSATLYLEQLGKIEASELESTGGIDNGPVRHVQKLTKDLTEYLTWISRVSEISTIVSQLLRAG